MDTEKDNAFGPIDIGMWSGSGWQYIREQTEKQEREKAQRALNAFIEASKDLEVLVTFGPFYVPGVGLRLPQHYKR